MGGGRGRRPRQRHLAHLVLLAGLVGAAPRAAAAPFDPDWAQDAYAGAQPATGHRAGQVAAREAAVAAQLLQAMVAASGGGDGVIASAPPPNLDGVDVGSLASRLVAAAVAGFQTSVIYAQANRGLRPQRLLGGGRTHYYQMPQGSPRGTVVSFPGCARAARGHWPYDPVYCKECFGLPEELSLTKQALKRGYALLALSPKDQKHLCWSSGTDISANDQSQARPPASLAQCWASSQTSCWRATCRACRSVTYAKLDVIKLRGVVSVVSTPSVNTWSVFQRDGRTLRVPPGVYPPTLFVTMADDPWGVSQAPVCVDLLRQNNVPSSYVVSPERIIRPSTLSDRIPVITPQQSVLIVQALQQVGLLDAEGWVVQDPKDYNRKGSKVYGWTRAVYELLPWMANSHSLNLNLRTSLIFQELTAADARHESMHDYATACLVWLESGGTANLTHLASIYKKTRLSLLNMTRNSVPPPAPAKPRPTSPAPKKVIPAARTVEAWHGRTIRLQCADGRVIIHLWGIRYGNPSKGVVSALCLRKATCIFTVTKEKFGNPCPAVPKSLRLGYRAREGRLAVARCPATNQVITSIVRPIYGSISHKAVATKCLRHHECSVAAVDQKFGIDRCKGVPKTLSFQYSCGAATAAKPSKARGR
ncbi:hypothetical protein CHLNCDRAFT_142323 [Chlorella variabilis]|uniref:SUEL-type lectin domain-containing protein n=1 Tax=Chlorella variabilis TaxID=554065 RepID=E1Z8A8_CHLVA|nr:hypothetical protein CHLNCDRAFT_142323 [Chlorella variabilis]EFN58062.1 hypothetical protein CHLNCDRAFT_142323 [Chlorella variabilis]|eukprot:XP_005850164.1 hypothetical protein CHLNCDRAFT_142323 [Chlorella variabilis]